MVMRSTMLIVAAICTHAWTDFAWSAPAALKYVKRETRQETYQATMAQHQPTVDWGPWMICGPFNNPDMKGYSVVFPPEIELDLSATYPGKNDFEVVWKEAIYHDWDPINLKQFGDDALHTHAVAYLYREFESPAEARMEFHVGSDDGLKLWFNGRVLIEADDYRGLNVEDHRITLNIHPGTNRLFAKITQSVGGWDFQMRPIVDHRIAAMLEYQLDLDFPTSDEARHYQLLSVLEPSNVVLEVGGLTTMPTPGSRPIVATRRGEIWIVDGAYDVPPFDAKFTRFASGLHEPLGAQWRDGALWVAQRGELTRLIDEDGDDVADIYETVSDQWGVSGNYHEFAFGPKFDAPGPDGRAWVTLNLGFCGSLGKSIVPWRGWAMIVNADGSLTPVCGGLRSPNGLGRNAAGDMFYTDNQGDWVGTNKLAHLGFGDWHGHPSGTEWYDTAGMSTPAGEEDFKPPAVWFPYPAMGQSASDILLDDTGGKFGPFAGQLFVGDQTIAAIMRVDLEKVDGEYQGACFMVRRGFDCGVNRMCWGSDGSMFVGMTNRGWGSLGRRPWGLQRVVYTGVEPFEILQMQAKPDGFVLTFTQPVDPETAERVESYEMTRFAYHRWEKYGSPEIHRENLNILSVEVSDDHRSVRLRIEGLRALFVHGLRCAGVRNAAGESLLHDEAYYTLNRIPGDQAADQ